MEEDAHNSRGGNRVSAKQQGEVPASTPEPVSGNISGETSQAVTPTLGVEQMDTDTRYRMFTIWWGSVNEVLQSRGQPDLPYEAANDLFSKFYRRTTNTITLKWLDEQLAKFP